MEHRARIHHDSDNVQTDHVTYAPRVVVTGSP